MFTEPFSFTMAAFPDDKSSSVTGEAMDNPQGGQAPDTYRLYRLFSDSWGAVSFHDDQALPADMCRPTGARIDDVPGTPAAVGRWLGSDPGFVVSDPVTMTVDGRPATAWDTATGSSCDKTAAFPAPWFGAGERHRIYAVPTGSDTILVITWGVDWGNGTEEHLDQVNAAADELVRSIKFER